MSDEKKIPTPAELASAAAESVRGLNHATLSVGHLEWEYPSHAYSVVGGLECATGYLPQALGQVRSLLSGLDADGRVGSAKGNPDEYLSAAGAALEEARRYAAALNAALKRAHNAISPLTYED